MCQFVAFSRKRGVMQTRTRANSWFEIVSIITLVVSVFSSPIRAPQTPNTQLATTFLCRNFACVTSDPRPSLPSHSIDCTCLDVDGSEIIEEKDEDESFWPFST